MAHRKYSRKREAILDLMKSTNTHPSAEWVYSTLKPQIPDLSLGTVYRNIAMFRDEGLIVSVATVDGQERFDADTTPHMHFICVDCGSVIDAGSLDENDLDVSFLEEQGLDMIAYNISFYGRCTECKDN